MQQQPSPFRATRSAASSRPACCPPCRSCPTHPIKSAQATCIRKPSPRLSPGRVARVAPNRRSHFQCFQTLENEVHNESPATIGRMPRSTMLMVEFDASVVEEADEPFPMVQTITKFVGDPGLARDARQLMLEPGPERHDERFALFLAHTATL